MLRLFERIQYIISLAAIVAEFYMASIYPKDLMMPMNRYIVPIILALGFINWIVQRCTHSLRINQTYDLWGGAIFTIVQIVLQACNFFPANALLNPGSIKICRLFFAAFWLLLWIVSVQGWMRFSECDFSMRAECMGKYGIGAR